MGGVDLISIHMLLKVEQNMFPDKRWTVGQMDGHTEFRAVQLVMYSDNALY